MGAVRVLKKYYILFLIIVLLGSIAIYNTYAMFTATVETDNIVNMDTDVVYKFKINGTQELKVTKGSKLRFNAVVENDMEGKISYGVYYKMISPTTIPAGVIIAQVSDDLVFTAKGQLEAGTNTTVPLVIKNPSDTDITVEIGVRTGYATSAQGVDDIIYNQGEIPITSFQTREEAGNDTCNATMECTSECVDKIENGMKNTYCYCLNGSVEYNPGKETLTKLGLTVKDTTPDFSKISPQNEVIVNSKYGNYTNVVNDTTYPFTYNSTDKTYTSTNKTNSATGTITFSPKESKKLGLCYTVSSEANYDKATFYVDNVQKAQVSGTASDCIDLGTVGPTNTIKVTYSKDSSGASGSDNVIFYLTDNYTINSDTGVYESEDDYGKSYYFRGNPTNNYVKFANKYWRIVRINGDGTIRMVYDGTVAHANGESSSDRQIGTSRFNSTYGDNAYVGYMMGIDNQCASTTSCSGTTRTTTYAQATANTYNSTIKVMVDNWYKTNIVDAGYSDKIADVIYCNDRSIDSSYGTGLGYGTNQTGYNARKRLYTNKAPILTCPQQNDAFTVDDTAKGNGALTYPVGLLTADEVSMAGGVNGSNNTGYYLYTGSIYWNMSPYDFGSGYAREFSVDSGGYLYGSNVSYERGVRPVVSLKSDIQLSGTGSKENPFTVQ